MALDLTYDPNWKPDSKSGDVDLTYDPNWKPQGILGGLGSSLKRGIDSTVDYGKISLTDNPDEIAGIVSENIRNRPQPSAAQQKMNAEIAPYAKEASDAQGIVGNIGAYAKLYGKRAMQLAENPREFAGMVAENLPNSAPGIAGMVAGGAVGAATPVPFGAAIGGVVGGTAGGYKIEQGSSMFDQVVKEAQARGIDTNNKPAMSAMIAEKYPEFLKASQLKGVGTAGTDAVLNVATLGVAGIGERALAREARSVADLAKAGKMTGEEAASAIAGIEAKNAARNTIGQKALRGAGVAAGEMAGESLSEAAGQQLAYGKLDPLDVVDEGLLAFGQGVGMAAGRKFISPLVGATDKDSVTQEIERARAFATALNQSVGGDVNAVPTLITDLGPLQQRIDDLHGIGNARMNDAERAKYEQEFNAAFGEVVGYTTDKDGMEIPFTMGDYLNSQVRSADITRDRPKAANAVQQSESRLQQVADEETTGYVAPEIPVVGTLSAVANMAIKSGANAQNQMQQAMQAALAKQGKPEKANGPIAAATDAQVATQGAQGAGGNVPGSAGVPSPSLAGNQERAGNGAEVAAPGLRPAVSAGIAGVPAGQLTPEVSRAAQPSQVAAQAAQANDAQAAPASQFDVSQRPNALRESAERRKGNATRDDLVGAIMRVTGGRGIAASMAQTVVGDKANNATKVRGLFTNVGVADLDDTATLLRDEEGYDVRDGNHLAELIRSQADGNPVYSTARIEREAAAEAEKRHRDEIRRNAKKFGIKTVARPFGEIEKEVLRRIDERHTEAVNKLDARARDRFDAMLKHAVEVADFDEVDAIITDAQNRFIGREFFTQATRQLRGYIDDLTLERQAQEQNNAIEETQGASEEPDWLRSGTENPGSRSDPAGTPEGARRQAGQQETGLTLKGQTNEQAAEQFAQQQAAKDKEAADKKAADDKAKADVEANDFRLAGSDRAADVAIAGGQAGLFGADGRATKAADQEPVKNETPSAATASAESVAKNQEPIKKQDQATDSAPQQKTDAAPEAKPTPAVDAEKPAESKSPAAIGDFGEKIGGAKKDLWTGYKDKLAGAEALDIKAEPLSKSWPAPDYEALIESGVDSFVVAFIRASRDSIPRKPTATWKLKSWAGGVELLRDTSKKLIDGELSSAQAKELLQKAGDVSRGMRDIAGRIELYQLVGHRQSLDGISLSNHFYSLYKGKENVNLWAVEKEAKATAFSNMPAEIVTGSTKQEVLDKFKALYDKVDFNKKADRAVTFDLYSQGGKFYVGKKMGRNITQLAGPFDTIKETRAYRDEHHDELVSRLEKAKEIPKVRRDKNEPRVGDDHRANLSALNSVVQAIMNRGDVAANNLSNLLIAHSGGSKLPSFINVPLETMPVSGKADDMDSALNELPSYRLWVFAKFLGNLNQANALSVKTYSRFDIPGKRLVQSAMLAIGHDEQVRRRIIQLIPVDVMNNLSGTKFSADGLLSNESMLGDGLSIDGKMPVRSPNPSVLAFVRAVAGVTAKVSSTNNIARVALKNDPAVIAGKFDGIAGKGAFSHDVSPEDFQEAFSFFGVEFGNYVEQSKRQQDLNESFDALMDMAAILNIPPKALSLNGQLGLAFGARGAGGIDPAAAHYERDFVVINLTKKEGAGSLGHEWFHALDNYFSRLRGKGSDMMTEALDVSLAGRGSDFIANTAVRKEMIQAFGRVVNSIKMTALRERSAKLDNKRSKAYWTTTPEMAARAFESYLISKLQDQNASNDYLANIVDPQTWKAAESLGFELDDSYPYPTAGEIPLIREAFDKFFQTVETKETDSGVMLYNQASLGKISPADKAIYGMATEGKSAADILKFIASASRSPFNRQVAKLLLKTGINPSITVGDGKGWKFNAGEGNKYAAGYDPKKDMISLFRPGAAERNMVHELIHAASLKALSRKSLASAQMKALFAHVQKNGRSAGLFYDAKTGAGIYGMANVDEFVAEAFSNPKFQQMLKQVSAPQRNDKPSSAWDWFVRVVRGILGVPQGQENALSRAIELGIGVMREDMKIRRSEAGVQFSEISGNEIEKALGRTIQEKARNWMKARLQGKSFQNDATGWDISVGRKGIGKVMMHAAKDVHSRSVVAIPDLIKNSVLVASEANKNTKERDDVPMVHHFYAPLRVGAVEYVARLVVKETRSGQRFYDFDTSDEISPAVLGETHTLSQTRGAAPSARLDMSMAELLSYVKAEHGGTDPKFIRYNVADEGWSVSERAKEAVMRLAGRPMLDPADPFAAENARLREQDQSLWSKAKKQLRRYLAPGGLLPQSVFAEKIKRDSEFQAVEFDVRHLIGGLEHAVKADFGIAFDKLSKEQMRPITEAMAGNVQASLPESTKTAAVAMRQYIDGMSTEYLKIIQQKIDAKMLKALETGKDADKAQAINDIELFEKIKGNIGRYVHRSYQAFDDPKWFEKVPSTVLNASRLYLKQGYMEAGKTDAKAAQLAEVTLHEILKNGTAYDSMESFIAESKLGAKDLSVLMRRKEVPAQIRALLGEYPDARLNFTKSATKMGRLIWNTRFLDRVRDIGMGSFFFEEKDRPPAATTQIAADGSEVYAPLNGLWTFPEIAQSFKDALGKEQMSDLYRAIVRANGLVKYGKTVLAPTTAMRNWQSAMFFSLANGHFDLTQMKKSIAAFREQVSQTATGNDLKYLRHLKQLGVVYDTPYAGEMARLMEDARMEELLSSDKGDAVRWFRKVNQLAQGFYTFGDDFWKIIGFENEKAGLMKAGLSLHEAEAEAAKRIRDTYPTYSMVGRGVQWLSRFPLAGTFVSFPAEIIRTSANMLRTVESDLKSDNPKLRDLGMKRAAGMALVSAAFYGLAALSMAMAGVGDDEEEAIRDLAPEWQKNSTFLYLGRDEKGNLRYFDMSFLDPYGYWKRPITAMMRDQPWEDSLASGLRGMLEPFLGADITAKAIFEAVANRKESGSKVYKEKDGAIDQAVDIADHLRKAIQPGAVGNVERLVKASTDVRRSSGQPYSVEDELVALVGWRATTVEPKTALYYRSFEFTDALAEARKTLTDTLRDANEISLDDIKDAKERAKAKQDQAFSEMQRLVAAAEAAGMSKMQIVQTLRLSNISQANIASLMRGATPAVTVTPQLAARAVQQARQLRGDEFAAAVSVRYRQAMAN